MSRSVWEQAQRLLCVRLDQIGDLLMTIPALRALRQARPQRRIVLLTSPSAIEAARLIPEVDEVIPYAAPWMKATPPRSESEPDLEMVRRLAEQRFDGAIIFTVFSQNPLPAALLCYLANIPLRLAFCRENPYQLLTHWVPETERDQAIRHEVRRQLDLVATIGARPDDERLAVRIPARARSVARRALEEARIDLGRPWVVVHPGATAPSRRYPPDLFAEAARQLALDHAYQVVFTATDSERGLVESIREQMRAPSVSLAGRLSLVELAALLELAPVLVANNSGPAHLAAAVGTPVVDLYALTNPQHTPWLVPHRVLFHDVPCKYCYRSVCPQGHHNCLRLVAPAVVAHAARELIEERSQLASAAGARG